MKKQKKWDKKYYLTEEMNKDLDFLEKLGSVDVMKKLETEVFKKWMEVDIENILGQKISQGQFLILLAECVRREEIILRDLIADVYDMKDNKRSKEERYPMGQMHNKIILDHAYLYPILWYLK